MATRQTELTYLTDEWGSNPLSRIERALFGACQRAGIPFDGIYTDDAVPEVEHGTSRRFSIGDVRAAWATPTLIRYMRSARPKAVIVKSGQLGPATVLAGWITGTPVIPWEPTFTDLEVGSVGPRMRVMFWLQRLIYRKAAALAGASTDVADWASRDRGVNRSRVFVWPNNFDLDRIRREGGAEGPPAAPPVRMIALGRLVEQKAYDVMIEAMAIASPDLPEWELEILGVEGVWRGNWRVRIDELIARHGLGDRVRLAGYLDNPYESLRRSHLFLHSARWEAFGNVIVEAMAVGTPVIVADCPGSPKEILDGGRFGKLVPNEDPEAFAAAVVELANDPVGRQRLGEIGRERSEAYSADRLLPKMLADIERVTGADFGRSRKGDGGSPQPPGAER
jgi:glycosyltransferase involved in cell wall biosynthesis